VSLAEAISSIATLLERGDAVGAERRAQAALASDPPHAEIWRLLAIAQVRVGRRDGARSSLEQALRLDPRALEAWCNLAAVHTLDGRLDEAQRALEAALDIASDHAVVLSSLGRLHHRRGDFGAAAACFERAVRARPDAPDALIELANARIAQHRWNDAEMHLRRVLGLQPDSPDAWYVLGYLFERQGRLRDAVAPYERSLALQPRAPTAHNLGLIYDQLDNLPAAVRVMQRALDLDPNLLELASHLAFAKRRLCDWTGLEALGDRLRHAVDSGLDGVVPFPFLAEDATSAQQLRCARRFARRFSPATLRPPQRADAADGLRVGFVSSGFNQHPTGLLIVELIERLRTTALRSVAWSTSPGDGSPLRARLEAAFNEFHDMTALPVAEIAQRIGAARIDILIDVDGYCRGSLPVLLAQRLAPVQINWLAYPGSLGAPWYDYLIADRWVVPDDQRVHYDEKIAYLPRCYQPTDTTRAVPDAARREECGLPASGFVFCCFSNNWKISPRRFALWMQLLAQTQGSVLWLLDATPQHNVPARLRETARVAGIDPQRLIFGQKVAHAEYLARLRLADLFVDTSPYGAHTTASDALFAGCPVLTQLGPTFASRVAGSLNRQLGFDKLIAQDDDDYLRIALDLARSPHRLAELRARLADPATRARLFDIDAYARDFSALLERIAQRAQRGETPSDLSL
jgi:predicted O-linked N-acetylglucosamine transferase (SPINDLY family)